ncbi:MAG TPA: OB-fold nucleic acid binding domain-containing protein, partial [Caulobacteraceae bacterium]|nr:OB-fold nucleic acid binding domain-containing protein [Caulobacteraceae bacterium]
RAQLAEAADTLIAYAQAAAADRASAQESLFGEGAHASRPRLLRTAPWDPVRRLDEELAAVGFYLSGHPLGDMTEVLRRRRVTFVVDALARAVAGEEAFWMSGIVRRRQERPAMSGGKFAFVTMSDPTGEYECRFQPDILRRCRDMLEPGRALVLRVRARASEGEVRFFAEDAEPLERAIEKVPAGLRIHLSPAIAEIEALRSRLTPAQSGGGPVAFVAAFAGGREVEMKLPGLWRLDPATRGALKTAPGVTLLEDV